MTVCKKMKQIGCGLLKHLTLVKDNIMNRVLYSKCSGNKTSAEKEMPNINCLRMYFSVTSSKFVDYNDAFLKEGGVFQ